MIKADITKVIVEKLHLKDKHSLQVVDSIIDSMKNVILKNNRLEIRDFGVFQIKTRKSRIGRNPKNKVEYPIPSRSVVTFKAGKEIKNLPVQSEEISSDAPSLPSDSSEES